MLRKLTEFNMSLGSQIQQLKMFLANIPFLIDLIYYMLSK